MSDVNPNDEFDFVKMPDGSLQAFPKGSITLATPATPAKSKVVEIPEYYVHLCDGSVERVKETEVPEIAGSNAPHGYYVRDGKAYLVTGVYPVETAHVEG